MIYVKQQGGGPLCPMDPEDPLHRLRVELQNKLYESLAPFRDKDGEYEDPRIQAVSECIGYSYMRLYVSSAGSLPGPHGRGFARVESWFWKCPTCGFVLPANEVKS